MRTKNKDHLSDGEDDVVEENQVAVKKPLTREEIERQQLEHVPVIADSEISPAAYLF